MTVDEWVEIYRQGLKSTTETGWRTYLNAVAAEFKGRELDSIQVPEIRSLVRKTEKNALKRALSRNGASAAEGMVSVCRSLWNDAILSGIATKNPAIGVPKPSRGRARDRRSLSEFEIEEIWETLGRKSADPVLALTVFRLALETGLRRSEMLGLTRGSMLKSSGCLEVTTRAKNGDIRLQPITQKLWNALQRLSDDRVKKPTKNTSLLVNKKGEAITRRWFENTAAMVRKEVEGLGPDGDLWFTWHLCRYTFGAAMERTSGYSIAAKGLGHQPSVRSGTTVLYTGASVDEVRRTVGLIWGEEMAGPGVYTK